MKNVLVYSIEGGGSAVTPFYKYETDAFGGRARFTNWIMNYCHLIKWH